MRKFIFKIVTLGCRVNQCESEFIRAHWQTLGGKEGAGEEKADIVCINSCAVTAHAERESRNAIYRIRRQLPEARILLTGCAAQLFAKFNPHKYGFYARPDAIITNKNQILDYPLEGEPCGENFFPPRPAQKSGFSRPVVKIQDGCDNFCAYCIVPFTRGAPKSRKPSEIAAEIINLQQNGHGEAVLSGINLARFKDDKHEDLWALLIWLENILLQKNVSRFRLRLSSIDPSMLTARAFEYLAGSRFITPHLHLSLQHGSDAILRRMGRKGYNAQDIMEIAENLSQIWPVFALGADFIAGFPGESEKDFTRLLELIEKLPLSYAHIFPYSPRPGTAAAKFSEQVSREVKTARAAAARQIVKKAREKFLARQLGLAGMDIVPERNLNATGRGINEYYIPCYFDSSGPTQMPIFRARPIRLYEDGLWVERESPPEAAEIPNLGN